MFSHEVGSADSSILPTMRDTLDVFLLLWIFHNGLEYLGLPGLPKGLRKDTCVLG